MVGRKYVNKRNSKIRSQQAQPIGSVKKIFLCHLAFSFFVLDRSRGVMGLNLGQMVMCHQRLKFIICSGVKNPKKYTLFWSQER